MKDKWFFALIILAVAYWIYLSYQLFLIILSSNDFYKVLLLIAGILGIGLQFLTIKNAVQKIRQIQREEE